MPACRTSVVTHRVGSTFGLLRRHGVQRPRLHASRNISLSLRQPQITTRVSPEETASAGPADVITATSDQPDVNPLEQLRITSDIAARAALMQQLDGCFSECSAKYRPLPIEQLLMAELGAAQHNVMMLAVMNPALATSYEVADARASIKALKAANVDVDDAWALLGKRHHLLGQPIVLQRWLDFLSVYGLRPRDLTNFLHRASPAMLATCTLYQAGLVVSFLRSRLGLKDEFLATRVLCLWPEVLSRDVETQLGAVVTYLLQLGLEMPDIAGAVALWPELLITPIKDRLEPFTQFLQDLGCSSVQVGEVLTRCPHLLGFPPSDVFTPLLDLLMAQADISRDDVCHMTRNSSSATYLTVRTSDAREVLDTLTTLVFVPPSRLRALLISCPAVLAEKPLELQRRMAFLLESGLASAPSTATAAAPALAPALPATSAVAPSAAATAATPTGASAAARPCDQSVHAHTARLEDEGSVAGSGNMGQTLQAPSRQSSVTSLQGAAGDALAECSFCEAAVAVAMACPTVLTASLSQLLGPRHGFVTRKGMQVVVLPVPGPDDEQSSSRRSMRQVGQQAGQVGQRAGQAGQPEGQGRQQVEQEAKGPNSRQDFNDDSGGAPVGGKAASDCHPDGGAGGIAGTAVGTTASSSSPAPSDGPSGESLGTDQAGCGAGGGRLAGQPAPADEMTSPAGNMAAPAGEMTLPQLLAPADDSAWLAARGWASGEYAEYRVRWEEAYVDRIHREAANEFQQELKKLGLYAGE